MRFLFHCLQNTVNSHVIATTSECYVDSPASCNTTRRRATGRPRAVSAGPEVGPLLLHKVVFLVSGKGWDALTTRAALAWIFVLASRVSEGVQKDCKWIASRICAVFRILSSRGPEWFRTGRVYDVRSRSWYTYWNPVGIQCCAAQLCWTLMVQSKSFEIWG